MYVLSIACFSHCNNFKICLLHITYNVFVMIRVKRYVHVRCEKCIFILHVTRHLHRFSSIKGNAVFPKVIMRNEQQDLYKINL